MKITIDKQSSWEREIDQTISRQTFLSYNVQIYLRCNNYGSNTNQNTIFTQILYNAELQVMYFNNNELSGFLRLSTEKNVVLNHSSPLKGGRGGGVRLDLSCRNTLQNK